uniref:Reverse transcriptase domain-containing protein n=1 Tax=Scylla olivacea TaxID=85551 RepID=A0A0P4WD55_SCYOL
MADISRLETKRIKGGTTLNSLATKYWEHRQFWMRLKSLLEVLQKILERITRRWLGNHLEREDLNLNEGQYSFRRGRGTTHAIAMATESLAIHHAFGYRCNLALRDISKAFDRMWHLGLKFKILHLGLPGPVERLLCDSLENRTARVRIGNHLGSPFPLHTGMPQGSVLSPTLCAVFTQDCLALGAGLNIQYAGDVSQLVFHPGQSSQMLTVRREVTRINSFERT